ncbi:MAG: SIMPL domain-containing protein [Chloroflexota bacterium]
MKRAKWLLAGLTLTVVLLLGAACDTGAAATTPQEGNSTGGTNNIGNLVNLTSAELAAYAGSLTSALGQMGDYQQAGIWVTGLGRVTLEPDLALLSLGVEARADTVEVARAEAAEAMTGIINALKARGIADKDIQTRYFNISPEYTYQEVYENGGRYGKQVLTGYRVSNTVTARVRDLDIVGATIDDVVLAGGDATRINSIQFTVEDSSVAQTQTRENAVLDALAKADQFATLTGVSRGALLFITESGGGIPVVRDFAKMEAVPSSDSAVTPISAGEMEIQVSIQAVFAIGSQ